MTSGTRRRGWVRHRVRRRPGALVLADLLPPPWMDSPKPRPRSSTLIPVQRRGRPRERSRRRPQRGLGGARRGPAGALCGPAGSRAGQRDGGPAPAPCERESWTAQPDAMRRSRRAGLAATSAGGSPCRCRWIPVRRSRSGRRLGVSEWAAPLRGAGAGSREGTWRGSRLPAGGTDAMRAGPTRPVAPAPTIIPQAAVLERWHGASA
jgi:hypothetical protein